MTCKHQKVKSLIFKTARKSKSPLNLYYIKIFNVQLSKILIQTRTELLVT